jgi:integrase
MSRMGRKRTKDKDLPARVYKRHGAFYFVARDGKWIRLGDTKATALRAYAELLEPSSTTFAAVAERYRLTILVRKSPKTQYEQEHQLSRLLTVFGHMGIGDIRRGHVAQYRDERGAPVAANREIALLSHIFARAMEWEIVDSNPCTGVERFTEKPRRRYVTDAEFLAVYEGAGPLIQIMMGLALLTGQRESDLLRIRASDLTDTGIAFQQRKTGKRLTVAWSDPLRFVARQALELPRSGVQSLYLICQPDGQPYTASGFQTAWQRHMTARMEGGKLAERFTFHDLRAKAGSDGSDGRLLGHADPRMLERVYKRKSEVVRPVR